MQRTDFGKMHCSIARSMAVLAEPWTPLILRDLLLGFTRFEEIRRNLEISTNVLTDRLAVLIAHGVVERVPSDAGPRRWEYRLTEKGKDLFAVVNALREWGDRWEAPDGPPIELEHLTCGERVHSVLTCSHCGEPLERSNVRARRGPGAGDPPLVSR